MAHVDGLASGRSITCNGAAQRLAKVVEETSGGRFRIEVFPGGQIMPPLECFDAASQGTIEAFMASASYWTAKEPALEWFTTIPFGMNPEGMTAWYHQGDGLKLWEEAYSPFNLVPRQGTTYAPQMAGWFRKKITTIGDYKGLKMRIGVPLGGKVYARAGGTAVLDPGADIYAALERGVIDAAEWVGPHDDMKLGLHKTARYYYYPGWHEPGSMTEFSFNKKAYDALPVDLRRTLDHAAAAVQVYGFTDFHAKNAIALERLRTEFKGKVEVLANPGAGAARAQEDWRARPSGKNRRRAPWPGRSMRPSRSSRRWSVPGTTSPKAPIISSSPDDNLTEARLRPSPMKLRRTPRGPGWLERPQSAAPAIRASRGSWVAVALVLWALIPAAEAQEARRPLRIGVLNAAWAASHPTVEGLKAGLKARGLEDGRDVTFDIRFTEGKLDAMPAAAAALVKAGVDLIFTSQEAATLAAKDATTNVPIVFTLVGDPVGAGIVSTLAQPGGNVTGVSSLQTELVAKRLEVLKTLTPAVRRVWLIYYGVDRSPAPMIGKALEAAERMKLDVVPKGVLDAGELKRVLGEVRRGDAILAPEGSNPDIAVAILEQSLAQRVPAVFETALWIGYGGLVSYGPDYYAEGAQAAALVAKILQGSRPQDLPVEGAEKIDLAVNLKTADLLGITVPRKILLRADAFRR